MTKKQRLFNHYAKLHNQLAELLGGEITYTEEYLNRYCKKINYTIAELEDMIRDYLKDEGKVLDETESSLKQRRIKTESLLHKLG
jgi:hypothetical protein